MGNEVFWVAVKWLFWVVSGGCCVVYTVYKVFWVAVGSLGVLGCYRVLVGLFCLVFWVVAKLLCSC